MKATKLLLKNYNWYYPPVIGAAIFEFIFKVLLMVILFPVAIVISIVKYYKHIQRKFD